MPMLPHRTFKNKSGVFGDNESRSQRDHVRNRLRQRAIVSLLKTNDSPPKILASQLFFLFDVKPHIDGISDNMTVENVLVAVGKILHSKQRLQEEVEAWARELFKAAGLPFDLTPAA